MIATRRSPHEAATVQQASPQPFGKYQILERVASGGMAEVFKARIEGVGGFRRLFAIKRVRPGLSRNREYVEMLVDEARVAGLLSHANIVQILDLGEVDGTYYVAMEYVDGRDLGSVLRRCTEKGITLPVPHAVFTSIEVLKGLEYAHNRQILRGGRPVPLRIVHRDVSPSNILVSFQGEVKLTDFGIAKAAVKALETVSGVLKGKFDYMSPEQASGEDIDQRTDIFAAGVVLYEMLCGVHPFRRDGELQTLEAIRSGDHRLPSEVNPDVPYGLEEVIERALAVDPEERIPTAGAFRKALEDFFHDAGFIFSHSTLAAFLKGLFPEAAPGRARRAARAPQDTVPLDPDQLAAPDEDLSELPTTAAEAGAEQAPLPEPVGAVTEVHSLTDGADISTLVARNDGEPSGRFGPIGEEDEATLIARRDPGGESWPDDQPTHLVPRATEPAPEPEATHPQVHASIHDETTVPPPEVLQEAAPRSADPLPPEASTASRAAERSLVARRRLAVYRTQLVALGALIGMAVGLLIGTRLAGSRAPEPPPGDRWPPRLLVAAPEGATLRVGERDVPLAPGGPTEVTLEAGTPTVVEVSLEGHAPFRRTFNLEPGAVRALTVEWAAPQEASP